MATKKAASKGVVSPTGEKFKSKAAMAKHEKSEPMKERMAEMKAVKKPIKK